MNLSKILTLICAAFVISLCACLASAPSFAVQESNYIHSEKELKALSKANAPVFKALAAWLETAPAPGIAQKTREAKLKTIDGPMMIEDASMLDCVGEFFHARMDSFLDAYLKAAPGDDVLIWKLYNHGEIIQTKDISIAIDLIQGFDKIQWDTEKMRMLVDKVDVLMISHNHSDHADMRVVNMFVNAGRPVIVPEILQEDYKHNSSITVVRDGTLELPGAKIRVFPSFQKQTMNNVYLIKTDSGKTIMHLGDNNNIFNAGHEWFRKFKNPINVDILIPNIWSPDLASLVKYVIPGRILSSHEHELGHKPSGRRTYDYVYDVLRTIDMPYYVPAWGEPVILSPDETPSKEK